MGRKSQPTTTSNNTTASITSSKNAESDKNNSNSNVKSTTSKSFESKSSAIGRQSYEGTISSNASPSDKSAVTTIKSNSSEHLVVPSSSTPTSLAKKITKSAASAAQDYQPPTSLIVTGYSEINQRPRRQIQHKFIKNIRRYTIDERVPPTLPQQSSAPPPPPLLPPPLPPPPPTTAISTISIIKTQIPPLNKNDGSTSSEKHETPTTISKKKQFQWHNLIKEIPTPKEDKKIINEEKKNKTLATRRSGRQLKSNFEGLLSSSSSGSGSNSNCSTEQNVFDKKTIINSETTNILVEIVSDLDEDNDNTITKTTTTSAEASTIKSIIHDPDEKYELIEIEDSNSQKSDCNYLSTKREVNNSVVTVESSDQDSRLSLTQIINNPEASNNANTPTPTLLSSEESQNNSILSETENVYGFIGEKPVLKKQSSSSSMSSSSGSSSPSKTATFQGAIDGLLHRKSKRFRQKQHDNNIIVANTDLLNSSDSKTTTIELISSSSQRVSVDLGNRFDDVNNKIMPNINYNRQQSLTSRASIKQQNNKSENEDSTPTPTLTPSRRITRMNSVAHTSSSSPLLLLSSSSPSPSPSSLSCSPLSLSFNTEEMQKTTTTVNIPSKRMTRLNSIACTPVTNDYKINNAESSLEYHNNIDKNQDVNLKYSINKKLFNLLSKNNRSNDLSTSVSTVENISSNLPQSPPQSINIKQSDTEVASLTLNESNKIQHINDENPDIQINDQSNKPDDSNITENNDDSTEQFTRNWKVIKKYERKNSNLKNVPLPSTTAETIISNVQNDEVVEINIDSTTASSSVTINPPDTNNTNEKSTLDNSLSDLYENSIVKPLKKRGRPRKEIFISPSKIPNLNESSLTNDILPKPQKKLGRPKKIIDSQLNLNNRPENVTNSSSSSMEFNEFELSLTKNGVDNELDPSKSLNLIKLPLTSSPAIVVPESQKSITNISSIKANDQHDKEINEITMTPTNRSKKETNDFENLTKKNEIKLNKIVDTSVVGNEIEIEKINETLPTKKSMKTKDKTSKNVNVINNKTVKDNLISEQPAINIAIKDNSTNQIVAVTGGGSDEVSVSDSNTTTSTTSTELHNQLLALDLLKKIEEATKSRSDSKSDSKSKKSSSSSPSSKVHKSSNSSNSSCSKYEGRSSSSSSYSHKDKSKKKSSSSSSSSHRSSGNSSYSSSSKSNTDDSKKSHSKDDNKYRSNNKSSSSKKSSTSSTSNRSIDNSGGDRDNKPVQQSKEHELEINDTENKFNIPATNDVSNKMLSSTKTTKVKRSRWETTTSTAAAAASPISGNNSSHNSSYSNKQTSMSKEPVDSYAILSNCYLPKMVKYDESLSIEALKAAEAAAAAAAIEDAKRAEASRIAKEEERIAKEAARLAQIRASKMAMHRPPSPPPPQSSSSTTTIITINSVSTDTIKHPPTPTDLQTKQHQIDKIKTNTQQIVTPVPPPTPPAQTTPLLTKAACKQYSIGSTKIDDNQLLAINEQFNSEQTKNHSEIAPLSEHNKNIPSSSTSSNNNNNNNNSVDEDTNIRRSGRIKTITETKQRSHGYGLVKDKERFQNLFSDVYGGNIQQDYQLHESSIGSSGGGGGSSNVSTISLSDLCDLDTSSSLDSSQRFIIPEQRIKSKEELDKEQENIKEGLSLFYQIVENEFQSERNISKEARRMTCDCFLTKSEIERGEFGCGEDCLNRMLMIECGSRCVVGDRCTNKRFQKRQNSDISIFKTDKKGFGVKATGVIWAGDFVMEYVGEVLNSQQFEQRAMEYSKDKNKHHYFMALRSDCVIDATSRGNISRFINHSCDPNAETQKWTVNGELRIGFFATRDIYPEEEITFDYLFQRYGKEAQKCYCEAENCRGWIGEEPETDEEYEDAEDEDEYEEDDEELSQQQVELPSSSPPCIVSTNKDDKVSNFDKSLKKLTDNIEITTDEIYTEGTAITVEKPDDEKPIPSTSDRIDDHQPPIKTAKQAESTNIKLKKSQKLKKDKKRIKTKKAEIMEDPDLDMEIDSLTKSNLKNQADTLKFSRLMVRAKLYKAKSQLLRILRSGELACRRLFLDYHGLKLLYNWMCDSISTDMKTEWEFRLEILRTLDVLPIVNKLKLQDSKVLPTVQKWANSSIEMNQEQLLIPPSSSCETGNLTKLPTMTAVESPSDSGSGTPMSDDHDSLLAAPTNIFNVTNEVLKNIPKLIEQNSAIKDSVGLEALKQIINLNNENTEKQREAAAIAAAATATSAVLQKNFESPIGLTSDQQESKSIPPPPPPPLPPPPQPSCPAEDTKTIENLSKLEEYAELMKHIKEIASKLVSVWELLPEVFRIPKKLQIEQMKEHEREANRSQLSGSFMDEVNLKSTQQKQRQRFGDPNRDQSSSSGGGSGGSSSSNSNFTSSTSINRGGSSGSSSGGGGNGEYDRYRWNSANRYKYQSAAAKYQRRQLFEAKVSAERVKAELEQIHMAKCKFFRLDNQIVTERDMPFCVNPFTGQWFAQLGHMVQTPPSHVHIKPPPKVLSTNPVDYKLPTMDLPPFWKYAIDTQGQLYYYHIKIRIPQWEPPIKLLPLNVIKNEKDEQQIKKEPLDGMSTILSSRLNDSINNDTKLNYNKNGDSGNDCFLSGNSIGSGIGGDGGSDSTSSTDTEDSDEEVLQLKLTKLHNARKLKKGDLGLVLKPLTSLDEEISALATTTLGTPPPQSPAQLPLPITTPLSVSIDLVDSMESILPSKQKKMRDGLVQERIISPRTEEEKMHAKLEMRRYKLNKEKMRRRKEESKRRKLASGGIHSITSSSSSTGSHSQQQQQQQQHYHHNEPLSRRLKKLTEGLPFLQDEIGSTPTDTSSLINELLPINRDIVNDEINGSPILTTGFGNQKNLVDELDMIRRPNKRHYVGDPSTSGTAGTNNKPQTDTNHIIPSIKRKRTDVPASVSSSSNIINTSSSQHVNSETARRIKDKFRADIAGVIVHHLGPYRKDTCKIGRITNNDDFKHLAKKLTHFVMLKELKHCDNTVNVLEVTDSVKSKSKEFIRKYMGKFGDVYVKPENDPDYRDFS